jgi:hypothetical protein
MDMVTTHQPSRSNHNLNHNIANIKSHRPLRPTTIPSNFSSSSNSTNCHRRSTLANAAHQS